MKCNACNGKGIQKRNDGIKIICPVCDGNGVKERKYTEKQIKDVLERYLNNPVFQVIQEGWFKTREIICIQSLKANILSQLQDSQQVRK